MKLPGISYSTQVQSLGRKDISLPLALGSAQAAAAKQFAILADKIDANETAGIAAQFQTEMADLNANIMNRKSFAVGELDEMGIKYNDKRYGGEGLQEVPAYLISKDVYKNLSKKVYNKHISGASPKARSVISKMYGGMYKTGISSIIKSSMAEAYSTRSVVIEMDFDAAVASGNGEAAYMIAETAQATGIWDADKYLAKTKDMPDKIGHANYLRDLEGSEDPVILDHKSAAMLHDPNLKPGTKNSLFRRYETKIKGLEKEAEKEANDAKKKSSYNKFTDNATDILRNGEPMNWSELNTLAQSMESADGKGLITLNRIVSEKGATTDPKTYSGLAIQVKSISIPRVGTTIYQRREAVVNELIRATGHDPITMNKVGPSRLAPDDFMKLFDSVNKSQAFAYDSPDVKRVSDQIYLSLTGGTKNIITTFLGAGPDVVNALMAEQALLKAARDAGPGFNPDAWWKQNGAEYATAALEENLQTLKENRMDKYIVPNMSDPGMMNMKETVRGINERIKSGTLTEEAGKQAISDINDIYRLRLQRMQMTKEAK